MNRLFEEYVGRIAARVFRAEGFRIRLQAPQRYLTFDESRCRDAFKMKPDVVGMREQQTSWIIDTKWKELSLEESRNRVLQSDLYQMYAYSNCYDCPEVVLLYPHQTALGHRAGVRASYRLKSWAGTASSGKVGRIRVATVDLTELKTMPAALRDLFNEKSMPPSAENEMHDRPTDSNQETRTI